MTITRQTIKDSVAIHGMDEGIKRALDGATVSELLDLALEMTNSVKDEFNRIFEQAYEQVTMQVIAKAKGKQ